MTRDTCWFLEYIFVSDFVLLVCFFFIFFIPISIAWCTVPRVIQKTISSFLIFSKIMYILKFSGTSLVEQSDCRVMYRSSHCRCSVRKGIFRNFAKFTENHHCQESFFIKVAGLRSTTLLKKRLWHRCFPVNCAKFLKTLFLAEHLRLLLLCVQSIYYTLPSQSNCSYFFQVSDNYYMSMRKFYIHDIWTKIVWRQQWKKVTNSRNISFGKSMGSME